MSDSFHCLQTGALKQEADNKALMVPKFACFRN